MSQVYFEDLEPGDEVGPLAKTPTREQIREYASLSTLSQGRFSSDEDAKGEGLQGMIVPGNMSMLAHNGPQRLVGHIHDGPLSRVMLRLINHVNTRIF